MAPIRKSVSSPVFFFFSFFLSLFLSWWMVQYVYHVYIHIHSSDAVSALRSRADLAVHGAIDRLAAVGLASQSRSPPPPPLAFACRSMWCVRWTIGGPTPSQDIWRWRCFSVRVQVLCPSAVRARYLFLCSSCNCLHWIDSFWENSPASLHWIDSFWECLFSLLQIAARSII